MKTAQSALLEKKDIIDYHGEINVHHFDKLPDQSVVVIDNVKYHSRQTEDSKKPTTGCRKAKIQEWLAERGVSFDPNDTIPIVLLKSKNVFVLKKFKLEVARRNADFKIKDVQALVCEVLKMLRKIG